MTPRNKLAAPLLTACLMISGMVAAQPKPITHEALWMMKRVGSPVPSPDGRWVVFSVVEPSYDPDGEISDLWIVPTNGSTPPRRITDTPAPESGVAWSPDSRRIAFSTRRAGDAADEIYILDLASGGEAQRLTNLSTGASNPKWRPDGGAILFESMVYPGALDDESNRKIAAERKVRKYNLRAYDHYPVRHWNQWLDDRQPTLLVQEMRPGSRPKDILSHTALARTSGFFGVTTSLGADSSLWPVWSPDGREVVFTATTERWDSVSHFARGNLYRMQAEGGAEPVMFSSTPGAFDDASFSPDGKSLFFVYTPVNDEAYNLPRLYRSPWPGGGESRPVTRDFDYETARYALAPDSRYAFLLARVAGKENLYRVAADGGKPALVTEPAAGGYTYLAIPQRVTNTQLIASYGSSVSPSEIVRIDLKGHRHTNLTEFDTAAAAAIDWQPPQHFYFTNAKGTSIHSMVVLPPAFDPARKYPLIVFLHGGPADNNPDQIILRWDYHLMAAPGYVVLMTDYTGSIGLGEKFARAIKMSPGKAPGEDIDAAVDEALKRYAFIDGSRMCAVGASYGGYLANWIEATTSRYRCIVSHAGVSDLGLQWGEADYPIAVEIGHTSGGPPWAENSVYKEQSPITYGANWHTPMLLSVGERDFRVPIGNTLETWTALQRMRVPSRLLVWPDAWHWILKAEDSRQFFKELHGWLATYLSDTPPSSRPHEVAGPRAQRLERP